jgi:hypothetical protein
MSRNYSIFTKKFFTYIINTCLLMDESYYKNDNIIVEDGIKYFTNPMSINKKLKILYDFDYENNIYNNKNVEKIYKKTKYLINILLKYLIILETNKNKLNLINQDKELILFEEDLIKINLDNNILEYILFNFNYELDSYINLINNLAEITKNNNLYLKKNVNLKEIKIDLIEKIVNEYYSSNSENLKKLTNTDIIYFNNIDKLKDISFNDPILITKEVIESIVLYNLV